MAEDECYLLTRLPPELRTIIYEHVLTFSRPLKLRQVVAGSPNTGILRANKQIYYESLPVLYDLNNIITTRNDFCHHTDPDLQTPLRKDQVRHLLVKNFSQSIKCSSYSGGNGMFLAGCCEVCQPTATGFVSALAGLPRIRSVVIDYRHHASEFKYMKDFIRRNGTLETLRKHRNLVCTDIAHFRLVGGSIPDGLSITFSDVAFHTLWSIFSNFASSLFSVYGISNETRILESLREDVDRDLTDKLWFFHCARHSLLWPGKFEEVARLWSEMDSINKSGRKEGLSDVMEAWTEEVARFCRMQTAEDARMQLGLLRVEEANLTEIMRMG